MKNKQFFKGFVLILFFVLMPCLGFAQKISVNYRDKSIVDVLSDLESRTTYSFVYQKQVLSDVANITCVMNNVTLTQVLDDICNKSDLSYEIVHQSIVIRKADVQQNLPAGAKFDLSGSVVDTQSEPQVGITVHNSTQNAYTTTDFDGKYSIKAAKGDVLVFSCIGMISQTVKVSGNRIVNIILENDKQMLEETIVIGYGSAKK